MTNPTAAQRLAADIRAILKSEAHALRSGQTVVPAIRDADALLAALDALNGKDDNGRATPDERPMKQLFGMHIDQKNKGGAKVKVDHLAIARVALPLRLAGSSWKEVADAVAEAGLAPDGLDRTQLVRSFEAAGAQVGAELAREIADRLDAAGGGRDITVRVAFCPMRASRFPDDASMFNSASKGLAMTQQEHPSTAAGATLPAEGFVRLHQLIGDSKSQPPIPPIVPVSRAQLRRWVLDGRFPAPIKFSPRMTMWPVAAIRQWLAEPKS